MSLDNRKILFFIAGVTATVDELAAISRIRGKVEVRSNAANATYGGKLEKADGLAGSIPEEYLDGGEVDTDIFPEGDVTPLDVEAPEAFKVFPAAVSVQATKTTPLFGISGDVNETTAGVTLTDKSKDAAVTWSSSNAAKATVDTDGIVTGVATGTATITATYEYETGKTVTSTSAITVTA